MDAKKRTLDGDLTRAFRERSGALNAIARRAGDSDAADLVQDAFLKTVEAAHKQEISNPVHLLYRVAKNTVIDRLRRRARWAKIAVHQPDADAVDLTPDVERRLIAAERLQLVMAAIEAMPAKRRQVFLMHRVEELSYVEISRALGVSLSAVEKHMRLAMAQLAKTVDEA